jgi:ATP phosphoribosyltransferase
LLEYLTIALPKGRLLLPVVELLRDAGIFNCEISEDTRKLVFDDPEHCSRVLLVKATDVPTYVQYGSADLGVSGKDVIDESRKDVCELLDLRVGRCRFVVAVPEASSVSRVEELSCNSRIATKYPWIAENYFHSMGIQVEVVTLSGSLELAPAVGLADAIVDITETGRTLSENALKVIAEVQVSSARLIANRVSYRARRNDILDVARRLEERLAGRIRPGMGGGECGCEAADRQSVASDD